ncbi:MAG: endonuclease/exonuclease/phosphatase family protein [Bacteroidota bacterium]
MKNKFHRISSIIIFILIFLIIFNSDSGFIDTDSSAKIILWNSARDKTTTEDIVDFVNGNKADIYLFIEFDKRKKKVAEKHNIDKLLPQYSLNQLSGNMAILVESGNEVTRIDSLDDSYNYFNIVEVSGIKYAIVDIGSWPFYNRAKPFEMLYQLVSKHYVDIIAGDFNTPYNSVHFEKFFQNYNCGITDNKYLRETFPSCIPLVSLDHIFVSTRFKITSYAPIAICKSDHYPLKINYE